MNLDRFAVWTGYFLGLMSVTITALGLAALASGHHGWGMVAAVALLVTAGLGFTVVGGTVHHDHKIHRETPHLM